MTGLEPYGAVHAFETIIAMKRADSIEVLDELAEKAFAKINLPYFAIAQFFLADASADVKCGQVVSKRVGPSATSATGTGIPARSPER
jgi:hypothetical protein